MMTEADVFHLEPETIARSIVKLPSLPVIVLDLLRSIEDENASADMLAAKVSADQALVARLLRVANSSFYGLQRKVLSVNDAIFVIGLGSVRNIALSATMYEALKSQLDAGSFDFPRHWRHSVATALCADALAGKMKCSRDGAFAAGLMHDIGQLVLSISFPKHLEAVAAYRLRFDCCTHEAERAVLGTDHAVIGKILTEHWNFPASLSEAVGAHHDPESLPGAGLPCVLHLADAIVHALDIADNESELVPRINASCWSAAGLSWADSQAIFLKVETGLEALSNVLSI
jgi:putative nucleotidyltransferase with HDIG domain